jgi:hypothetical protein
MKKVIRLTESDLVRLVKRVLKEDGPEAIASENYGTEVFYTFPEGSVRQGGAIPDYCIAKFMGDGQMNEYGPKDPIIVKNIARSLKDSGALEVIAKYNKSQYNRGNLPQFIYLNASTSTSGTGGVNAEVGQARLNYVENIVTQAFRSLGVDLSVIKQIIKREATRYNPEYIDRNFFDTTQIDPTDQLRYASINIKYLSEKGLDTKGIQDVQRGLNQAQSVINTIFVDNVDEAEVVKYIRKLQTFSDITDLSDAINASGRFVSLEDFLNDQLFDDTDEMRQIAGHLKMLAQRSQKQADTIRLINTGNGTRITIGTGR